MSGIFARLIAVRYLKAVLVDISNLLAIYAALTFFFESSK